MPNDEINEGRNVHIVTRKEVGTEEKDFMTDRTCFDAFYENVISDSKETCDRHVHVKVHQPMSEMTFENVAIYLSQVVTRIMNEKVSIIIRIVIFYPSFYSHIFRTKVKMWKCLIARVELVVS